MHVNSANLALQSHMYLCNAEPKGKSWPFDGMVKFLRQAPQLTHSMQPSSNMEDPVIKELDKATRMMHEADKLLQSAEKKADAILYKVSHLLVLSIHGWNLMLCN